MSQRNNEITFQIRVRNGENHGGICYAVVIIDVTKEGEYKLYCDGADIKAVIGGCHRGG